MAEFVELIIFLASGKQRSLDRGKKKVCVEEKAISVPVAGAKVINRSIVAPLFGKCEISLRLRRMSIGWKERDMARYFPTFHCMALWS
jgi:hypothetical protein